MDSLVDYISYEKGYNNPKRHSTAHERMYYSVDPTWSSLEETSLFSTKISSVGALVRQGFHYKESRGEDLPTWEKKTLPSWSQDLVKSCKILVYHWLFTSTNCGFVCVPSLCCSNNCSYLHTRTWLVYRCREFSRGREVRNKSSLVLLANILEVITKLSKLLEHKKNLEASWFEQRRDVSMVRTLFPTENKTISESNADQRIILPLLKTKEDQHSSEFFTCGRLRSSSVKVILAPKSVRQLATACSRVRSGKRKVLLFVWAIIS